MDAIVRLLLVLAVLYVAGRIMYQGRGRAYRFRMMHVVLSFFLVMVVSALIMAALIAASIALEFAAETASPDVSIPFFTDTGKLAGGNLLVYILLLVFLTAFAHYGMRAALSRRHRLLVLEDDEIQIFEYFIQWLTIYLVVYQCVFEGFSQLAGWFQAADGESLQGIFEIALKPQNINLVVQPLLISSWILVVLERFARQSRPKRAEERRRAQAETEEDDGR